ncbi:hypothetical protein ACIPVK_08415 [Paeniglutamicibacter sp. MACA_103]|uniref:hypothetical protein n=1 Tax=Paeniglutamicibacter sp. MACA_103 TaxID=3377337 RepID=UPI003894DAE9
MNEIEPASYKFTTASGSLYLLEIAPARATLTRLPRESVPEPALADRPSALRKDEQPVEVLRILQFGIGLNGIFVLDLRGDGVPTLRTTSPIRGIEALEGPAASP